jgi:hypothetical protein
VLVPRRPETGSDRLGARGHQRVEPARADTGRRLDGHGRLRRQAARDPLQSYPAVLHDDGFHGNPVIGSRKVAFGFLFRLPGVDYNHRATAEAIVTRHPPDTGRPPHRNC